MTAYGPPHQPSDPHWDRLARYFAGESPRDEAEAVERWLAANPGDARSFTQLNKAIDEVAAGAGGDVEAALRKVKTRVARPAPGRRPWAFALAGVAAAAAVVAIVVLPRSDRPTTATETRYTTERGGRQAVSLADGTRILLGPSSRMTVGGRVIRLEGEAYFTMSPAKAGPYSVRAGGVTIRDIGTEFGVRAYPDEPLRVVVSSGIVEVESPSGRVVLDSGDVGVMGPGGAVARTVDAVTADDVAWMQGRLVFRNASMSELRADLRRWYGVELRVTDSSLLGRHFTGSFSGEPAARVGDVIALALGARAERHGDTIFIRPTRR